MIDHPLIVTASTRCHFVVSDATTYSLIRRGHTEPEFYTVVPNEWVRDARLSWKAKGVMAGILSHADGFDGFSLDWLVAHGTERIDAVRSGIRELEALGYLVRKEYRVSGRARTDWATADPTGSDYPRRRTARPVDNSPGRISRGGSAEAVNPRAKNTTQRTPRQNTSQSTLNAAGAAGDEEHERRAWRTGDPIPDGTVRRLNDALVAASAYHLLSAQVEHLRALPDWSAVAQHVTRWCGIQTAVRNGAAPTPLVSALIGGEYIDSDEAWASLLASSTPQAHPGVCTILDSGYCDAHGRKDCEYARL
ncbi:hypothetical protein [Microbacterium natoriense]